ncbi:hypothetical protein [Cohnella hongkongensis]|uniref:Major facilitator superfamily (MFS) profile domain-containing protein n=1 Tax=Cohnella hongkongensis TaxID=178337 RepID=A0ABV9FP12_9BACL
MSTTFALMGGVAPVLSGFIIQLFGWHGLFVVSLLIVLIIPFVVKHFPTHVAQGEKFDVLGAILFSLAVGILVLGISLNPYLLIIAVLMLIAFSFHIRGKKAPFITISLLANKNSEIPCSLYLQAHLHIRPLYFYCPWFYNRAVTCKQA